MCSGCSGDWAGDFEDSDEPTHDSGGDPPARYNGRSKGDRNPLVRRDFEPPTCWQRDSRLGNSPVADGEVSEGIFEIMVSATRIVEIRVIPTNPGEVFEFSKGQAAGKLATHKHSEAASAKYYQTFAGITGVACDRAEVPIFRGFAARAAGEFGKWVRWMRSASGKERRKEFHRSLVAIGRRDGSTRNGSPGANRADPNERAGNL